MDEIQKRSVIEPIVVRTVTFGVIRRSQHGHLVSIDGVTSEEVFHFDGQLKFKWWLYFLNGQMIFFLFLKQNTSCGVFLFPHKWISLQNILYGPQCAIFLNFPK